MIWTPDIEIQRGRGLDPTNVDDFVRIETSLSTILKRKARPAQEDAIIRIGAALKNPPVTPGGISEFQAAIRDEVLGMAGPTAEATKETVKGSTRSVYTRTRSALRRRAGLGAIGTTFQGEDFEAVRFMQRQNTFFVRDSFGAVSDAASARARRIVGDGLEKGLGSKEIAATLEREILDRLRKKGYMETLATMFVNRSRTSSELNAFSQVGVELFIFRAVLDESTTDICSFLDGMTFSVGKAKAAMQAAGALPQPEDIEFTMPFLRQMTIKKKSGERVKAIGFLTEGGKKRIVAEVLKSNIGQAGPGGEFKQRMTEAQMQNSGIGPPPAHFRCVLTGTCILASGGWIPVENLRVGDLVLTHSGQWRLIVQIESRQTWEDIAGLVVPNGSAWLTEDHPVLTIDGYVPAGELRRGDKIVGLPAIGPEKDLPQTISPPQSKHRERQGWNGRQDMSLRDIFPRFQISDWQVLFGPLPEFRPGRSDSFQKSETGFGSSQGLSCETKGQDCPLLSMRNRIRDVETAPRHMFCEVPPNQPSARRMDRVSILWREILVYPRSRETGETNGLFYRDLLFQEMSKSRAIGQCRYSTTVRDDDGWEGKPDVRQIPRSSEREHHLSGGTPSEYLRVSVLPGDGHRRSEVGIRAEEIRDVESDICPGLLSARSGSMDRGEGVGPRGASHSPRRFLQQAWPDPPRESEMAKGYRRIPIIESRTASGAGRRVYTVAVDEDQTFIVDGGILTHNCRSDAEPLF